MKKRFTPLLLIFISLLSIVEFTSCKKEVKDEIVTYTVAVKVEDNLSYSVKISDGNETPYNVIPPAKNASTTIQHYQKKGTTAFVYAETNNHFKGKMIEVIVTKTSTGEIVEQEKGTENVTVTWLVN